MGKTFGELLKQSSKNLRATKVDSLNEQLLALYNNEINTLVLNIKDYYREREDIILNMYPDTTISNDIGKNFNPTDFIKNDLDIALNIRDAKIKLELVVKRFKELFNSEPMNISGVNEVLELSKND